MPLDPPPRDAAGAVQPHDHAGIADTDGIIRRVSQQFVVVDAEGCRRLSSLAFSPSSGENGGMSVDLEELIKEAGLDPRGYVTTRVFIAAVKFTAKDLRDEGFQVGFDPIADNPYHGEIWGKFTKGQKKRLLKLCCWLVELDGVSLG